MNETKHIHKYMRVTYGGKRIKRKEDGIRVIEKVGGYTVFKCQEPMCNSYMPRDLVIGNASICWVCELPLILDMENTKLKKPTHTYCRKVREKIERVA